MELIADAMVERRLLVLSFLPFLPVDSGRGEPATEPVTEPGVVPFPYKKLAWTFEAESEGVKEVVLLFIIDRGAGVSYGEPVVETLGNLMLAGSGGCVGATILCERPWPREILDVVSLRTEGRGGGGKACA